MVLPRRPVMRQSSAGAAPTCIHCLREMRRDLWCRSGKPVAPIMNTIAAAIPEPSALRRALRSTSIALDRRPGLTLFLLLVPPLMWLGIVYLGSLFALLAQSFFSLDDFTGQIVREFSLRSYRELL